MDNTEDPISATSLPAGSPLPSLNPTDLLREQTRLLVEINQSLEKIEKAHQSTNQKLKEMQAVTNQLLEKQDDLALQRKVRRKRG